MKLKKGYILHEAKVVFFIVIFVLCCFVRLIWFVTLSYFDGDLPEEEKHKAEVKSEEEDEEIIPGQKKKSHSSKR